MGKGSGSGLTRGDLHLDGRAQPLALRQLVLRKGFGRADHERAAEHRNRQRCRDRTPLPAHEAGDPAGKPEHDQGVQRQQRQ